MSSVSKVIREFAFSQAGTSGGFDRDYARLALALDFAA
jgi:hypothetical protein